jgi:Flp pilus assembly protein TadD
MDRPAVLAEERRLHQARRAIEKAIHLLAAGGGDAGEDPD